MKKIILFLSFFLLTISHLSAERTKKKGEDTSTHSSKNNQTYTNVNYSILIEEDYNTTMFLFRYSDNRNNAQIISYGGYKWFKEVFKGNEKALLKVAIQPHGTSGSKMSSWFTPRYLLNSFVHIYEEWEGNQSINFATDDGLIRINGYISRGEKFEFAVTDDVVWYGGKFTPIKSIEDFKIIAKKNSLVFCMIVNDPVLTTINRELAHGNIINLLGQEGYKCDSNNNLR